MINGGSSSGRGCCGSGVSVRKPASSSWHGLTHSNDTTGKDRKANGFRHFFNAYMSGAALASDPREGTRCRSPGLSPDGRLYLGLDPGGVDHRHRPRAMGWETVEQGADSGRRGRLLVLHHAGSPVGRRRACSEPLRRRHGELADPGGAVRPSRQKRSANGKDFKIVVPLYSELMAAGAGENIKGVLGSMNWNWQLGDEGTAAFVKSFGEKYGLPALRFGPHVLRADAALCGCRDAGRFVPAPCAVAEALEGFEFDGMGNGPTLYRAEDHQCFKDVLVVRGAENPTIAVRHARDRRSHAGCAGHLSARSPDVRWSGSLARRVQQRRIIAHLISPVALSGGRHLYAGAQRFRTGDSNIAGGAMDAIILQISEWPG